MEMIPFGAQFGVKRTASPDARPQRYDPVSQKTLELGEDGVWRAAVADPDPGGYCYCTGTGMFCTFVSYFQTDPYHMDEECGGLDYQDDCGDYRC